uniref:FZ domain-containing protein n=1 Tax=Salarias fasciatus TaxID=181472 RepID=A0A672FRD8_SALFA
MTVCLRQGPSSAPTQAAPGTCQPITSSICKSQPYTETIMPNFLGQLLQSDAELTLQTFIPLITVGCYPQLKTQTTGGTIVNDM